MVKAGLAAGRGWAALAKKRKGENIGSAHVAIVMATLKAMPATEGLKDPKGHRCSVPFGDPQLPRADSVPSWTQAASEVRTLGLHGEDCMLCVKQVLRT